MSSSGLAHPQKRLHRAVKGFSYGCQMKNPSRLPCIENVKEPNKLSFVDAFALGITQGRFLSLFS
jgi:hypothetical protein